MSLSRPLTIAVLSASLAVALPAGVALARGFGGGGARGGGFGGGGFRGGSFGGGGYRGGGFEGGGFRGGYGGASSFGHTPSFSSAGSFNRGGYGGGTGYGGRGAAEGMSGGRIEYGSRSGSYDTARGGTINYGAAGVGGRGAEGGMAGRGVYGVSGTTAGGRSYGEVGRAGGAVGPGGNGVAGRSNIGGVSGPNGAIAGGSRGGAAFGPNGAIAGGSRGGAAIGPNGAVAGRSSWGAGAYRPNGFNAYGGYHQGWVHGYWNGHNDAAWGWRSPYWGGGSAWGLGVGMGLGWGLSSWGFGSSLYGMGYSSYANPYYAAGALPAVSMPYDYAQPIDTTAAPAAAAVTDPAMALFDAGRASFQQGDYADALQQTDSALAKLPNDTTLHEFRALCLFALGRYDEAAGTLYAVLSVGPGWDWTTMIGLYPGIDVYTAQLRALEAYCNSRPESAPGPFVLAYQYLTQGHNEAAVVMLKRVVALKPGDTLSAKLLRQLDPSQGSPAPAAVGSPANATAPADTTPPQGASIAGTWNAQPVAGTNIALTVQPGGEFTWAATQKGQTRRFAGSSTYGDGILTLAQASGPALVGRVSWTDPSHMTFRVVGDGPDDPGLVFSK